jgi:hypothetical protein
MVSREPRAKVSYQKPELVVVDLKAEEVLAVGCKMVGRTAPNHPVICMGNNCAGPGS